MAVATLQPHGLVREVQATAPAAPQPGSLHITCSLQPLCTFQQEGETQTLPTWACPKGPADGHFPKAKPRFPLAAPTSLNPEPCRCHAQPPGSPDPAQAASEQGRAWPVWEDERPGHSPGRSVRTALLGEPGGPRRQRTAEQQRGIPFTSKPLGSPTS